MKREEIPVRLSKGDVAKQNILQIAREEIVRKGIEELTHQSIANRLGLSKSSVLYHYPSKTALWQGLIEDYVKHLETESNAALEPFVAAGLTPSEAIIPSMFLWFKNFNRKDNDWVAVGVSLMGQHVHNHSLTAPVREWYCKLYRRIDESGLPRNRARMIMMFFDGIFNSVKLGIESVPDGEIEDLQRFALRYLFEGSPMKLQIIEAIIDKSGSRCQEHGS